MPDILWRKEEILSAISGDAIGNLHDNYKDIIIDSRNVTDGSIFFAIKGHNLDGHDYAKQAYANGASLIIIEKSKLYLFTDDNIPMLVVDDVLKALEKLARFSRKRSKAKIIAITGSSGKTTLKEMMASALSCYGKTYANPASFNNHWGVPLSMARLPIDAEYGVFEMGMNHPGELQYLCDIVRPFMTVITNIAPAHIGNFASIDAIAEAKSEIYSHQLREGIALINSDIDYYEILSNKARSFGIKNIKGFGKKRNSHCILIDYKQVKGGGELTYEMNEQICKITISLSGEYLAYNVLATLSAIDLMGNDVEKALLKIMSFNALKGRGLEIKLNLGNYREALLIDESYNANPESMVQAIRNTVQRESTGRIILVLGDMLELGSQSKIMHEELFHTIHNGKVDIVYLIGENMQYLANKLCNSNLSVTWVHSVIEIIPLLENIISDGDIVMVKSSNSIATHKIVKSLIDKYK